MLEQLTETVDRIERVIGGTIYKASVLTPDERIESGNVAQLGPLAFFQSASSPMSGTVAQHLSVYEPALIPAAKSDWPAIAALMENEEAIVPIDPSGIRISNATGSANGWWDHIKQGGPVMIPILGLAILATLIALVKTGQLARLGTRTPEDLSALVEALNQQQIEKAQSLASHVRPPQVDLIRYGIEHHHQSRLLLEELLEERIFIVKAKLERALPWIAVTAASAPLLGLLGTVTGMIDTFGLIAAYGSGDPKLLSSGISEALITTKFGLGMAIPAMLVHAFLNRKVKRIVVAMEQTAWRFVNELHTQRGNAFSEGRGQ
jgi:biopolymer transport protein ExbB